MLETLDIPDDLAACQQLVRELFEANRRLQKIHEELLATCTSVQDSQLKLEQEKEELEQTIKELMHRLYGRRSERHIVSPDQLSLDFGEGEPVAVIPDVTDDEAFVAEHEEKKKRRKKKKRGGQFPEHLERRGERIEPVLPEGVRPEDCELIGVDIVEILEFERPRLWVRRLEYPKYKILSQPELNIQQGPREASLIPGGSFGFGIAAEVLFNKFALHLPLYRQQDPFAQLGWAPNRSTLCQIVINSTELLRPLAELEIERILAASVINTDDTEVTLLTPGVGKGSRKARFWIYRSNEAGAMYDAFAFTNSRARAGPDEFLQSFRGTICGDCYSGYVNIEDVTDGRIAFSACNTHARRYVFNAREQHAELSSEIVALYGILYDIEERGRRLNSVERLHLRRHESVPLMKRIEFLIHSPAALKLLPKSKLGQAIGYMRNNWDALKRFLSDAHLPIDNNQAEHALRRIAVGRKNWLFVGSENGGERAAVILTVIASAHRHDLDVWAYLRDVLERMANDVQNLEDLLPDVWKASHPEHVRDFREEERQHRADDRRYQNAKRRIERVKA
ncbi:MAG: IS66 family transposase [Dehalococcoidia bacterium]|jgi:transposase|nr:IS66 family transposase [Dehalococcoidia bacterium]|tara:strand:+ start:980 stop:2674 length:1695 start_codon:yes stop_codon:yes gene_type:complete